MQQDCMQDWCFCRLAARLQSLALSFRFWQGMLVEPRAPYYLLVVIGSALLAELLEAHCFIARFAIPCALSTTNHRSFLLLYDVASRQLGTI